jgi:hypothetical protein
MIENSDALNWLRAFFASEEAPPDVEAVLAAILEEAQKHAGLYGMLRPGFVPGPYANTFTLVDLAGDPPSDAVN